MNATNYRPCRECRHFIDMRNARTFCGKPVPPGCSVCRREIELGILQHCPKFRYGGNDITNICPDFARPRKAKVTHG